MDAWSAAANDPGNQLPDHLQTAFPCATCRDALQLCCNRFLILKKRWARSKSFKSPCCQDVPRRRLPIALTQLNLANNVLGDQECPPCQCDLRQPPLRNY